MDNKFKISVLIPCHSLKYLSNAIASIEAQSISKNLFEVVIVLDRIDVKDANSILRKFNLNYRILESSKPGIVAALNFGLDEIDSPFVARMDEDDLMMPYRLQSQLNYLESNKNVLAVGGQIQTIDESGNVLGRVAYKRIIKNKESHLLVRSPMAHPAVMFRLESVSKAGGYRDFLPEDWDLWLRLRERGDIENLAEIVIQYRVHPSQLSREKMYSHHTAKRTIAVSYFARKSSILDKPNPKQSPDEWIRETESTLREKSQDFIKFEKFIKKQEEIENLFRVDKESKQIWPYFATTIKYPILTLFYLMQRIWNKIKNNLF
jgi:glycosyltransferase involved in cell wall biosynthesis